MKQTLYMTLICLAFLNGCRPKADTGSLDFHVGYRVNGQELATDTLRYVNEAGNQFMITEIQWFLSHLEIQDSQGQWTAIGEEVRYFDTGIPASHSISIEDIPLGTYQALRFTFGLDEADNRTGRFPNPPEANMFWPEPLGGGYHYMKLNGRWLNTNLELQPFNIHLGVGQNAGLTEFYPNHFTVTLPIDLTIKKSQENSISLTMVIDNWFRGPNLYDFNHYGSAIMQNQEAQQALRENGHDVFEAHAETSFVEDLARPISKITKAAAPQPHFFTLEHMGKLWSDLTHKNKKP